MFFGGAKGYCRYGDLEPFKISYSEITGGNENDKN